MSAATNVILVHGAWADGSCWSNVILPLKREGLNVIAASIPLTSLSDDIATLHRTIGRTEGPVVLAGHAYAGAVIAATRHERVKSLVYVAALAPDEDETVADVFYHAAPHPMAPRLAPDGDGFIWMPDEGFSRAVAHRASQDQLVIIAATQRPIAVACIQEKSPPPAWKSIPSFYFVATEDRMILPETQQFMAGRMGATIRSQEADHTPMHTAPNLVIDIIMEAVKETLSV